MVVVTLVMCLHDGVSGPFDCSDVVIVVVVMVTLVPGLRELNT